LLQSTLKAAVSFEGIGVHSGNPCRITVCPRDENGVAFRTKKDSIEALYNMASETTMCTKLSGANGSSVSTIEHLSSAMYGLGITGAVVDVEGDEIPILDGSALPFVEAFLATGIEQLSHRRRVCKLMKPVKVQDGKKWASLTPADSFSINIKCDFTQKGLKTDPMRFDFSKDNFLKEIAPARTFGFFADMDFLRKNNLASGASLENTLVFDDKGNPLNENGLRLPNEPIRHKILDVIGDLSLIGGAIMARFDAFCPSHKLNNQIVFALFENKDNFEMID
jgi:UDP-3-O-[3-hydroxymyristoyl] N-acetylglucosamine deacetylase